MSRNNVTRLLDTRKVPYQVFTVPAVKLGAVETAHILHVDPSLVYKTIVVKRERGKPILAVIPGHHQVDLKLLASALGEKKLFLPTESEAEKMTGLQAGGISPLALINRGFQVVLSGEARNLAHIHVSGGERGVNIRIPVDSLVELTHAEILSISTPGEKTPNI